MEKQDTEAFKEEAFEVEVEGWKVTGPGDFRTSGGSEGISGSGKGTSGNQGISCGGKGTSGGGS